jgi:hypothetical protein
VLHKLGDSHWGKNTLRVFENRVLRTGILPKLVRQHNRERYMMKTFVKMSATNCNKQQSMKNCLSH